MTKISLGFGLLLIVLGVAFYYATKQASMTALIPAFFGVAILICGLIAIKPSARKHAAHVAALVGLLGIAGGFGMSIPKFMKGEANLATLEQLIFGIVCAVYVFFCVRSFIAARKAKKKLEKMAKSA